MQTLSGLIEQSLNRIKEATIGVLDITDDKLRGHLRQLINNELGNEIGRASCRERVLCSV